MPGKGLIIMADTVQAYKILTSGNADEVTNLADFDAAVERSGAFKIYREVEGQFIQPRIETEDKGARIDRVLVPLHKVLDAGWKRGGAIGVEAKRGGKTAGPLICQAMDYSRCAFNLKMENGDLLIVASLQWIFIYPCERPSGDLESVMVNHRIGACFFDRGCLEFWCSGTNAIRIYADGTVKAKDLPMGRKRGSR